MITTSKIWLKENLKGDPVIWFVVFLLSLLSVAVVYSATGTLAYKMMSGNTEHYLRKHSMFMILSLAVMWFCHKLDYKYYAKISRVALLVSIPLLLFTYLFGSNLNEASRWFTIPIFNQSFQPSDLAKFALFSSLASMLAKRQQNIADIKETLIPLLLWVGGICGASIKQVQSAK